MSTIGGPGGVGGPKGPDDVGDAAEVEGADKNTATTATASSDIDVLAAEVAAGRLTPQEAIDRIVDATAAADLGPAERAELREMLVDLIANDPYLGTLANRV